MTNKKQGTTTQKTLKEKVEIPIPKRGDVFKVFKNAAKPVKSDSARAARGSKK